MYSKESWNDAWKYRDRNLSGSGYSDDVDAVCNAIALSLKIRTLSREKCNNTSMNVFNLLQNFEYGLISDENINLIRCQMQSFVNEVCYWRCTFSPNITKKLSVDSLQLIFWLQNWMSGADPPPRCSSPCCTYLAVEDAKYCYDHQCQAQNCKDIRSYLSRYCSSHTCGLISSCPEDRLLGSKYCNTHTCPACLLSKEQNPSTICDSSLSCSKHRCEHFNQNNERCINFQDIPFEYCDSHCCITCKELGGKVFCSSIAKDEECRYSDLHICNMTYCIHRRSICSRFCNSHTCVACIDTSNLLSVDTSCPDCELCEKHRCAVESCRNLRGESSFYCADHERKLIVASKKGDSGSDRGDFVNITCSGITKKTKTCKTTGRAVPGQLWYCKDHIYQMKFNVATRCKVFNCDAVGCQNFTRVDLRRPWQCPSHLIEPQPLSSTGSSNEVISNVDINSSGAGVGKVQRYDKEDRPGISSTPLLRNKSKLDQLVVPADCQGPNYESSKISSDFIPLCL